MNKNSLSSACGAAIILSSVGALQIATAEAQQSSQIDEIVITAQKRSERLMDVPVSVTAMSGEQISKRRIANPEDLASFVPNLQLSATVGPGTPIFALRGVSMSDYSLNQAGPVATYYNEVYKGNFAFLGVAMFDLDRIEVLRGPQGTLYGKNTTGGAVNLISRVADFNTEGYIAAGYGNYNRYEAEGAVQTAISETVAARIAFTFMRADGWFKNLLPGKPDLDDKRQYAIRGSVKIRPSDTFDLVIQASTSLQNPHNYGLFNEPGLDGIGAGVYALFGGQDYYRENVGRREGEFNYTPRRHARTNAISATANLQVGDDLTLTSISSWDKGNLSVPEDSDGAPLRAIEILYESDAKQISEDFRLTSDYAGPFNFIFGAYYNKETIYNRTDFMVFQDIDVNGDSVIDSTDCVDGFPLACQIQNQFDQRKNSFALYSDLKYDLTDSLKLRGGLRYTRDRGKLRNFLSQGSGVDDVVLINLIPGSITDLNATTDADFKKSNISGKIGLDYQINDQGMIYVSYSRGYRAPSFNAQAFFAPEELTVAKAEILDAVELGLKSEFFDNKLQVNGAIFWYGYKNQQFVDIDPVTTAQRLVNLSRSRIVGGELEFRAVPTPSLRWSGGLGILSSRVNEGVVQGTDISGNRLSNAPTLTVSSAIDWTLLEANWGTVELNVNGSFTSKQYFEAFNKSDLIQSSYALLNAKLSLRSSDGNKGISFWAKNLTNKYYFTSRLDISGFGFHYNHVGDPRTYGVTLDMNF